MTKPLLHPATDTAIEHFVRKPSHALLIVAPTGAGKSTVAQYIACQLLGTAQKKLFDHPYFKYIRSADGKSISIDAVRDITHYLSLKTPGVKGTHRVVLIEDAQRMTQQAQNALLKTVEEPPAGAVLILTAPSELGILSTIRSRIQKLLLQPPSSRDIAAYFHGEGFSSSETDKALLMSNGLVGLAHALLVTDNKHPLIAASSQARDILQKSTFERLLMIDDLAKDRQRWLDVLFMLGRMAYIAIHKDGASEAIIRRWQKILAACNEAESQTLSSAQSKLVVLNFMLTI